MTRRRLPALASKLWPELETMNAHRRQDVLFELWGAAFSIPLALFGLIWLALTVVFEFLFGHYVVGHPWSRLLHDYNILQGRVWALVLIWTAVVPYVIYRLRVW